MKRYRLFKILLCIHLEQKKKTLIFLSFDFLSINLLAIAYHPTYYKHTHYKLYSCVYAVDYSSTLKIHQSFSLQLNIHNSLSPSLYLY
jgi:hypothetical protein